MKGRVEKAVYGGDGLLRMEGKAIFVPFTLPGEEVEVRITEDKGSYARGTAAAVLTQSPLRSAPECLHFQHCGGCHWQHTPYENELALKQQVLAETLARGGVRELPTIEIVNADPGAYRNRIRVAMDDAGSIGFRQSNSRQIVALVECPIAAPLLVRAIDALRQTSDLLKPGDEAELFCNAEETELLLTLHTQRFVSAAKEPFDALCAKLPQLAGLSIANGRKPTRTLCGIGELPYRIGERMYSVAAGAFFQANRRLLPQLVELVPGDQAGREAWDLYAGVGLFSAVLAERFEQVTAVELAQDAIPSLRRNLGRGRILEQETLAFLRSTNRRPAPELIVVDPPRTGLGRPVAEALAKIRPRQIRYLSCDPATMARDLKILCDSGYLCRTVHLIDLFPRTYHTETLAVLELR